MARCRTHSIEFKHQVAQEHLSRETLHGLSKRHDITRKLIRVWVRKYEEGAFDEDAQAADPRNMRPGSLPLSGSSARSPGTEVLKGVLKSAPPPRPSGKAG